MVKRVHYVLYGGFITFGASVRQAMNVEVAIPPTAMSPKWFHSPALFQGA